MPASWILEDEEGREGISIPGGGEGVSRAQSFKTWGVGGEEDTEA